MIVKQRFSDSVVLAG